MPPKLNFSEGKVNYVTLIRPHLGPKAKKNNYYLLRVIDLMYTHSYNNVKQYSIIKFHTVLMKKKWREILDNK